MIDRIRETRDAARERIREKALAIKGSITRQRIMNILGVYVDEESDEEVSYDNALKEIFYDILLRLYYGGEEECEQ